jgi:signal transduction histidine kinase/DNA-binding NarL/FixJ family response regulator
MREEGDEGNGVLGSETRLESVRRLRFAVLANQAQVWEWRIAEGRVFRTDFAARSSHDSPLPRWQDIASWLSEMHADDAPQVSALLDECLTKSVDRVRLHYRVQIGSSLRWFEVVGIVGYRRPTGELVQMLGTETDVTESKRVIQLLSSAQKRAEEANRTKSEFLANMSHEVRTPLNAVIGLTRLLRKTKLDAQQTTYLDMVDSSAKALLTILNDVLDLSKIEAGRMTLDMVGFNLRDWLEDAVLPYVTQVHEKGLDFELSVVPNVPQVVVGDPGRLRQIITNLVSNAVRFTKAGGIVVTVSLVNQLPATGSNGNDPDVVHLNFAVRDSGVGIAQEAMDRIFQAFEQADASTTRRFGGTGLGLAISQRLAAMFGSTIRVSSILGQGSVFEMTAEFKIATDSHVSALTQPVPIHNASLVGLRVLVAEDNPINQLLVRQMLEEMKMIITLVADGDQALRAWQNNKFDVILMDVQMPVMGGDEVVRHIRRQEAKRNYRTPIIAMTAHALTGDRERYLRIGMDAYVSKPLSPESLLLGIQQATARNGYDTRHLLMETLSLKFDSRYDTTLDTQFTASLGEQS